MNTIKRVLVTGGTGFVGHWMERTQPESIKAVFLSNHDYYHSYWERQQWDAIAHLAPISPFDVLHYGSEVRVLFASSGAVYDGQTEYAVNKRRWEKDCAESGADCVIARLFTFVGAHLKNQYAITNFIEDARKGGPIRVLGDGNAVRTYLYGDDLGRWMWKILLEGHGIYDVGSGKEYTILEVARAVASVLPSSINILNTMGIPSSHYVPDITRALEIGCKETVGLLQAIKRTIDEAE